MKSYPSISKEVRGDIYTYTFAKYDGSNIRAEWNPKRGFYKFGTRTQLIDSNSQFAKAIPLIKEKYEKDLTDIFRSCKWESAICFMEFYGPSSFAGSHKEDEEQTVTLFDVAPYKYGLLPPDQFIKYFGHLDVAKLLYEGYVNKELFDQVKQSILPGMPFEGVVVKGFEKNKPIMFKIKSQAWLDKLKEFCRDNEELFNRLS